MLHSRQLRLRNLLAEHQLDVLALVPGTNLTYVSGIHSHLSERPTVYLFSAEPPPAIIIPSLEAMKAEAAGIPTDHIFAWRDEDGYAAAFKAAADKLGLANAKVAVESTKMRVLEYEQLANLKADLNHADDLLLALRLSKDAFEIEQMQKAVHVAEDAMQAVLPLIKVGMTEKEVANLILLALLQHGADAVSFSPIVSAGPNSASPHATPTDRPLAEGDLLILDWGAQVGDYVSDITRTFAVGYISDELRRIYDIVRRANEAGIAACAPEATGEAIDAATRDVIEQAGYGSFFIHRTGHGLGMEAHEPPSIVAGSTLPLPVGAAFTIEPGIYLPDKGGVRIEDDVVISAENNVRVLTSMTKELMSVG